MATKLDKNFGLGNSYKNVKLVKSAVRKVDSEVDDKVSTEQMNTAIAQLKAGTLPVYEVSNSEDTMNAIFNKIEQVPCIIKLIGDAWVQYHLVVESIVEDLIIVHYLIPNNTNNTIEYIYSEWSDLNDLWDDSNSSTIEYADVSQVGTKLYFKRILDTTNYIQIRLFLQDVPEFTSAQPIIQGIYGYAQNSKHYIFRYCTPENNRCSMTLYCIEDANEISVVYNNNNLQD